MKIKNLNLFILLFIFINNMNINKIGMTSKFIQLWFIKKRLDVVNLLKKNETNGFKP